MLSIRGGVSISSIRTGFVGSAVICFLLASLLDVSWAPERGGQQPPLKVYLLAGQSNMVGQGSMDHLDLLVQDEYQSEFREAALWNGTSYNEREDVFITYEGRHGKLTAGRKSGFADKGNFGPELMFGWTVGDAFPDEKILLIKTAWGGESLAVDFRPPSSGDGNYTGLLQPSSPDGYGYFYREMIANILDSLDNIGTVVPDYNDEAGYTVEGFVWFQGWNDMLHVKTVNEYAFNLRNLINDVRLDLDLPNLPFVIGELGMHGEDLSFLTKPGAKERVEGLRDAQESVALLAEFQNTTKFVRTAPYAVMSGVAYQGEYHYNGRADTVFHIGQAFANGMLDLMEEQENV